MKIEISSKCGEIFRNGPALFTFACIECGQLFDSTKGIFDHIETHFFQEQEHNNKVLRCENEYIPELKQNINATTEVVIKKEILLDKNTTIEIDNFHHTLSTDGKEVVTNVAILQRKYLEKSEINNDKQELKKPDDYFLFKYTDAVQCDICKKITQRRNIRDHLDIHSSKRKYSCAICNKKLRTRTALSSHWHIKHNENERQSHTFSIPFQKSRDLIECDICGKKLRRSNVINHMDTHSNVQKFTCSICNKKLKTKLSLASHERRHRAKIKTEKDAKRFSCDICGWMFREQSNLVAHIRRHSDAKPYKCKVCGKAFSHSSYINIHMRGHTGETPYKCTMCSASFKGNSALYFHIRMKHTQLRPYKCSVCDKTFSRSRGLQEHNRIHTGERPYTCSFCNNSFARKNTYKQHLLLHTGVKAYKCQFCDMSFTQFAGRASHLKSVHKSLLSAVSSENVSNSTHISKV